MKKIALISDTHNDISNLEQIIQEDNIDYIIHLGDDYVDVDRIRIKYPEIPIFYIMGNHDMDWLEPKEAIFQIYGIKIYATHGNKFNVKMTHDELIKRAKELDASIALYGHSHIQKCTKKDGVILVNPGSLSESRDYNISGSYIIMKIDENKITFECKWKEFEEILGVEINTVVLKEYNPVYKELFNKEKEKLKNLLGDTILQIEHVGSTSMPGIVSKPIIDMVCAIKDIKEIENIKEILVKNGYIYKGPIESKNDRYQFLKGNSTKRDFHIYFTTLNSDVWYDYVLYRDYLLEHPDELKKYESIKKKLAILYPFDRRNYLKHKQKYINTIHIKARKLYLNQNYIITE